jgi:hypothetical protein
MQEIKLKCPKAANKVFAVIDERRRSAENKVDYTDEDFAIIDYALSVLKDTYKVDKMYVNYRKKFAAIKLPHPVARSMSKLKAAERELAVYSCVKVVTEQGTIYRFPK